MSQAPLAGGATFASTQPIRPDASASSAAAISASAPQAGPSIACCVRLKVADAKGNSVGSGTIIDARQGEALILTCGHLFRDSNGKGAISVDLFGANAPQHVPGRLIGCDLDRDVALVDIAVKTPVVAARVAPPDYAVHQGDRVIGIGCSDGRDPTVQDSHVDALDRFRGPANIEVAGQPVQGAAAAGCSTPRDR